jgi:hypothetical protein
MYDVRLFCPVQGVVASCCVFFWCRIAVLVRSTSVRRTDPGFYVTPKHFLLLGFQKTALEIDFRSCFLT